MPPPIYYGQDITIHEDLSMDNLQAPKWTFRRHGKYIGKAISGANQLFLSSMAEGSTLNLCSGFDTTGDVLMDADLATLQGRQETITERVRVNGDVHNLPFKERSFDTVICDPPYHFYAKQSWIFALFHIARKRLILSVPTVDIRPPEGWTRDLYYIGSNHYMLRLWYVFNKS